MGNESPLVSIIIPVFNTENFIGRAIESVLAQTYINIEVIVVNDGSEDRSGEICDQYARSDTRIKIIHQKNRGVSAARNAGLDIALGKYIQFIDSDDEILSNMTERFVNEMENLECDIVICGFANVGEERKDISAQTRITNTRLFEINELLVLSYIDSEISPIVWSSCNMMFKNSLISGNKLRFDTLFAKGEDGLFTLEYLAKCKRALVVDQVYYIHHIYNPKERVSAISQFSPDLYELRIKYFERLFFILIGKINTQELTLILQQFHDKLIAGLVRLAAYSEYFTKDDLKSRLSSIVNNDIVIRSGKVYKRRRKEDSRLIPLFIKWKFVNLLLFTLKNKRKHYIKKYGKDSIIRSIYAK